MIGTISIAGSMKEKPDIQVAEKPKPLKPLIIEAIRMIITNKKKSNKFKLIKFKKSIKIYIYH